MTKIMTGFWFLMTVLIGVGTYWVSHEVERLERRYAAIQSDILDEQESIHVFQAEWSYLNQPARLEALSTRLLGMDAPVAAQTVSMQELLQQIDPEAAEQGQGTEIAEKSPSLKRRAPQPQSDDWLTPILAKLKKSQ